MQKKHGITFQQTAYKHLRGHKQCPECLREDNVERSLMETSEFIERANKTHNNRYSYDKVDTKNRDENGIADYINLFGSLAHDLNQISIY